MMNTAQPKIPFWTTHLEKLINKALAMDEETREALAVLEGKVIGFQFTNTQLCLFLFPCESDLRIRTLYEDKPDVLIKGTSLNFMNMMMASAERGRGLPSDMELIGDIGLAQRFQHIMQNIDIDLEEPLSSLLGDTVAYQLGLLMRGGQAFAKNTVATLANDISEYLRFESEILPDALLVKEYCEEVDQLREDVDRLVQRIERLRSAVKFD